MKVRVCFLAMMLAPLFYYGAIQMAPAGRAATVSSSFHQLGRTAFQRIEKAQEAQSEPDNVFEQRIAEAEQAVAIANTAAVSAADRREYMQLVSYLHSVKQDRLLMQASSDSNLVDQEQSNNARSGAEKIFR
jgi:hypothetical protein